MLRSFALAIGVTCILAGIECFGVQQFVFNRKMPVNQPPKADISYSVSDPVLPDESKSMTYNTTEETPWICLATGVIVISYTILLPRRFGS